MNGKNNRPPARTPAIPLPVAYDRGSSEVDGVNIIAAQPLPRLWLHVTFTFVSACDPARIALAAATFGAKLYAFDRMLRLTVDPNQSAATAGELVLVFAPRRWGVLEARQLDEVKPLVRDLATAAFEGAEVKSVEVVTEPRL